MTTCHTCSSTWTGYRTQHCACCHQTFSGDASGDKHRVGDHNDGTRHCADPAERGLVQHNRNGHVVWMLPNTTGHVWY